MRATLALAKELRRSNPDFDTPIFYYRPYPGNPMAEQSKERGYVFPNGLEAWADFDYVGGRGPWITPDRTWGIWICSRTSAERWGTTVRHGSLLENER